MNRWRIGGRGVMPMEEEEEEEWGGSRWVGSSDSGHQVSRKESIDDGIASL